MADTGSFGSAGENVVIFLPRVGGVDQSWDRITSERSGPTDGMNMITRFIDGDFRALDELHTDNWLRFLRNRSRGKLSHEIEDKVQLV
jgi:hypothetical protein